MSFLGGFRVIEHSAYKFKQLCYTKNDRSPIFD